MGTQHVALWLCVAFLIHHTFHAPRVSDRVGWPQGCCGLPNPAYLLRVQTLDWASWLSGKWEVKPWGHCGVRADGNTRANSAGPSIQAHLLGLVSPVL